MMNTSCSQKLVPTKPGQLQPKLTGREQSLKVELDRIMLNTHAAGPHLTARARASCRRYGRPHLLVHRRLEANECLDDRHVEKGQQLCH